MGEGGDMGIVRNFRCGAESPCSSCPRGMVSMMAREPIANATAEHKYEVDKRWQDGSNTMCDNIVFPLDMPASNRSVWDVTATSYQPNALAYTRAQPHQQYTAAPLTRTTSAQVFRKLFTMFVATAFAFVEQHTDRTLFLYLALSNDVLLARASAKSSFSKCLRSQLQNCSTRFRSGDRGGTFHILTFCFL